MTLGSSLHWSRIIYDWFCAQASLEADPWPIVLDADDFIADAKLVREYSRFIGLDESKLKFTWEAVGEEALSKLPPTVKTMGSALLASAGVSKTRNPREIIIDDEAKKWGQEFGDDVAAALERNVRAAMPDYDYLWSRRFRREAAES